MAKILVIYGSHDGHTAFIAHTLADVLRSHDQTVDVRDAASLPSSFSPRVFDGILVGASVRWGHHHPAIRKFLRENALSLSRKPAWFFSVSLAAADAAGAGRTRAAQRVDELVAECGWTPGRIELLAGALRYREYGPILRQVMRLVAHEAGLSTDTSKDQVFTDWPEVRRFARDFVQRVEPRDLEEERGTFAPITEEAARVGVDPSEQATVIAEHGVLH
jgi:menaquinone-dependent protoporphyrinogen oxidase